MWGCSCWRNALATAAALAVIILLTQQVSGGHLNPLVSLADWWIGRRWRTGFTASTSFANPAVTIGRMFSETFAGIAPISVLSFIAAQIVGAVAGVVMAVNLYPERAEESDMSAAWS
jgi:glycerol uptake facilitator-like aquaporin